MGLSRINTILFDFDGTLMDSNELIADSWRHTIKTMTCGDITDDDIRSTFGEVIADSMDRLLPGADAEEATAVFRGFQNEIFLDRISLFKGAKETLYRLKDAGYKQALVTSRLRQSTNRALVHFGLENHFDAVLTASDTDKFKPDPTPLFIILDSIGRKPEDAMFIGDTVHDIEAGQNAGVFTVLVDFSYALPPGKRTATPAPDKVIMELRDILKLLNIE